MINVPHAFTPEYPADETSSKPCKTPVIINVYDGYMFGTNTHELAVDVEEAFESICAMSWCHQSQITEWLPWVGRHNLEPPKSLSEWAGLLRKRFQHKSKELGIPTDRAAEVFTVTAWGVIPTYDRILADFPRLLPGASNLDQLRAKLRRWS
jgi:hypothetical protein